MWYNNTWSLGSTVNNHLALRAEPKDKGGKS